VTEPHKLLKAERGRPLAPNVLNTLTLHTVALGQLHVPRFDPAAPEAPFELTLRPIEGAYVICLQRTLGGKPASEPLPARFGRTNNLGWMLERDAQDAEGPAPHAQYLPQQTLFGEPVGDPPPVPACDQLLLDPGETYEIFWSLDLARFQQCCQALEERPGVFPEAFPAQRIVFRAIELPDLSELRIGDADLTRRVGQHLLRTGNATGFVREPGMGWEVGIFDVTPAPLRALYLCEFLQWYTVHNLHKSSKNLAVLTRAKNLVEAALHGRPDFYMDAQFHAEPGSPEREVLDHYRDFVWQCAANGVEDALLRQSLRVSDNSLRDGDEPGWHKAALEIRKQTQGAAVHPVFRRAIKATRLVLYSSTASTLADYFDLYTLGARLRQRRFAEVSGAELVRLSALTDANAEFKAQLLSGYAEHAIFMDALDRAFDERHQRIQLELTERYWDACADACYEWWKPLEQYTADDWKRFTERAKWITGVAGGFGDAFKGFFDRPLNAYKLAQVKANAALTTFFRYHAASVNHQGLQVFEEKLPTLQTKVRVNFRDNTITVLEAYDGTTRLSEAVPLTFTTEVQRRDPAALEPPSGNMTDKRRQRFDLAKATGHVVEYDVELPVDVRRAQNLGLKLPAALGLACGSVNTVLGTLAAVDELKRGVKLERANIEAWFELGKNALGLVDSIGAVQEAMRPKGDGLFSRVSSALKGVSRSVTVLDGAYNLASGMELLCSDDGAVAYELRHARTVRAQALRVKGVVQLASAAVSGGVAASSLIMFGGGSVTGALALAAGPVGLALAAGAILVVCIDATLALTRESGEQTAALEAELDKAEREELPPADGAQRRHKRLTERIELLQERMQAAQV
jgi:hypothetical protein